MQGADKELRYLTAILELTYNNGLNKETIGQQDTLQHIQRLDRVDDLFIFSDIGKGMAFNATYMPNNREVGFKGIDFKGSSFDKSEVVVNRSKTSTTVGFDKWLEKGEANNKVYFGMKGGTAQYVGITKQIKDTRLNQHNNTGKGFDDLDIQYDDLTRNQARAVEQYFIENGPNTLNKSNSISPNNKYYQDAMNWAKQYLGVE